MVTVFIMDEPRNIGRRIEKAVELTAITNGAVRSPRSIAPMPTAELTSISQVARPAALEAPLLPAIGDLIVLARPDIDGFVRFRGEATDKM